MSDIERRISKLEEKIVPVPFYADYSLDELKQLVADYTSKHFGRKLSEREMEKVSTLVMNKRMNLSDVTEADIADQ